MFAQASQIIATPVSISKPKASVNLALGIRIVAALLFVGAMITLSVALGAAATNVMG